ncbi:MAG: leucine-rich repeat domain-containing protein, partial [Myxococcota bacterium]|nr:leucine-rich repeat domain-containing protein [Myxococcota bacterium]
MNNRTPFWKTIDGLTQAELKDRLNEVRPSVTNEDVLWDTLGASKISDWYALLDLAEHHMLGEELLIWILECLISFHADWIMNAEEWYLPNLNLSKLPQNFSQLSNLRCLILSGNNFETFPKQLTEVPLLKKLDLSMNNIRALPKNWGTLNTLEELHLSENQLSVLPREMGGLSNLKHLSIWGNQISQLPIELGVLPLRHFNISHNELSQFPLCLAQLSNLCHLDLSFN